VTGSSSISCDPEVAAWRTTPVQESSSSLKTVTTTPVTRIYYLDCMRGFLMMLGVVLHAANVYGVRGTWEIHDAAGVPAFDLLSDLIRLFRMPSFFIVAGFFASMSLTQRSASQFLAERACRLLPPFVCVFCTLNVLQLWLQEGDSWFILSRDAFVWTRLPELLREGRVIQHLWFLIVLMWYCAATALFAGVLTGKRERHLRQNIPFGLRTLLGCICIFEIGASLLVHVWAPLGDYMLGGLIAPSYLLRYLPYFLFGLWLEANRSELDLFSRISIPRMFSLAALWVGSQLVLPKLSSGWHQGGQLLAGAVCTWLACQVCFSVFRWLSDRPQRWARYLAEASYSVYLFHHILIVILAQNLQLVAISVTAKFVVVVLGAFLGSFAIHEGLIRHNTALLPLLNGRFTQRKKPVKGEFVAHTTSNPK